MFGADLIAGFPTETDEMFENTARLVEECGLTFLHVFPYSPRPGTPAARMPQVPGDAIKARARRLRALGQERLGAVLPAFRGRRVDALMETETIGRTREYLAVEFDRIQEPGALVAVDVTGARGDKLIGRAVA